MEGWFCHTPAVTYNLGTLWRPLREELAVKDTQAPYVVNLMWM